ncbi:aspartyl/asparaginyl beta-hydroxylase domain-containing protein [Actinomadura alba]|uniref:Aspartyl/asparaginyl beta-hydroxylase domain-containing protein n=1 Tax=Actinomadura alba TaxID=406431 RepID=A0ABR7LMM5_9ACTN|nr:aspartyl/asparaginyl beta-hydroxylase domain-containing protein [Actinomadura alba]MBC6465658.1 aspartyl/asparaginyl beta-hydroxylase domain-containing protein [Actinomadura alba]
MITYPEAAPLASFFDVARLNADLDVLRHERWGAQRPFGQDGLHRQAEIDWQILPLRSIGGDPARTDAGGAGLADYADTPWLAKSPYLGETLAAIPAPVRGVRLMALGVGTTVHEHRDSKYGFSYGTLRLHVPIDTNPESIVVIDGRPRHWDAGRLWFGDFGRLHYVANTGDRARVHMVIDCLITPELIELFPPDFRERLPRSEVVFASDPVPLTAAEVAGFRCRFAVPGEFPQWSEDETTAEPDVEGAIEVLDGRLVLTIGGEPAFGLVHLGLGEFRLVGWTGERTIVVDPASTVRFRVREGRRLDESIRPARPA